MNETFMLYLFTRLDTLCLTLGLLCLVSGIATAITVVVAGVMTSDGNEVPKVFNKIWYGFVVIILLIVIVPNKRDVAVIMAGSTIISIARTDEAKRITGKSVQVVEQYLDELLKEKK